MLTVLAYIFFGILGAVLLVALFNVIAGPQLKSAPELQLSPRVSIMVPARNEEHNIERCIRSLMKQDYADFQVLALDDHSTDRTKNILDKLAGEYSNLQVLVGAELPADWTGKNWACHQLSREADGEVFIFTDADNWHAPDAVRNSVAWVEHYHLDLFSAFSQQITKSLAEKLIVPLIDLIIYGSLPLWLTYYTEKPSLAAANGQWIVMPADSYGKIGGHTEVRSKIVEDTELARLAKRMRLKTLTAAGTNAVYARMYRNFQQVWEGMSKILVGLMGYKTIPFVAAMILSFAVGVLPYFLIWFPNLTLFSAAAIGINMLVRLLLALRYKHQVIVSVVLHPVSLLIAIMIGINSIRQAYTGTATWKNRKVELKNLVAKTYNK